MSRTAKIYARLQSQKSGSAKHIRYLLDGHGTEADEPKFWTKGIPKAIAAAGDCHPRDKVDPFEGVPRTHP